MRMLLEVEGEKPEQVRCFAKVEAALRKLDASGPHSFASLTRQDGSYVQVAGGKERCLIEKRDITDNTHWRACSAGAPSFSEAPQILEFGGGRITMTADEIFHIDDVVSVWCDFFESRPFPENIMWRNMTDMFRGS
ncbi:hypothetical protein [Oleidesulfovibrio sp.]|uniref:hypothetical protein n=1 Tax=Oleidesulfovibrio sp. TaxID=2909707 RepID=UPI003A87AB3E